MSLACASTIGNVNAPSDGVRAPSATVCGLWIVWSVFERNDRVASSPAAGSTPITRQAGDIVEAASAAPESSAAWHEQNVERSHLFEQLPRGGALAGDDVRVIVRWDEREPTLGGEARADGFAVFALAIVEDDLAAVAFGRHALDSGRVRRHHDHPRDIEDSAGERDGLRMISGGKRHDAAPAFVGGELREGVVGAAKLEGAGALEILAFEEQLRTGLLVEAPGRHDGRAMGNACDPPCRSLDIWVSRERHFSFPSGSVIAGEGTPGKSHRCLVTSSWANATTIRSSKLRIAV